MIIHHHQDPIHRHPPRVYHPMKTIQVISTMNKIHFHRHHRMIMSISDICLLVSLNYTEFILIMLN